MQTDEIFDVVKYYPEITGVHPACLAVPRISDEDRVVLEESIANEGLRHEIVLTKDGELVDGRNRLIACYKGSIEPRFRKVSTDPWHVAHAENIARRHIDTKQKSVFGLAWLNHEKAEAKKRQGHGQTAPGKPKNALGNVSQSVPEPVRASDIIGQRVGVSYKSIEKAARIAEYAPEMLADDSTLEEAYREAKKRKAEQDLNIVEKPQKVEKQAEMTSIFTASGRESQIAKPKAVRFNKTTDAVDWAAWTWNPVTGCEHGCRFCYAREIAHTDRMAEYYPNKFEPTYHPYRLEAPKNTSVPDSDDDRDGRVFVCSMADLFGKWVPDEWIRSVFDACLASPEWEYLFLTKWPERYSRLPLIKNAWYGSSVVKQADVARVEKSMAKISDDSIVRWCSMEPMLEPIKFNTLDWCDLIVIGGQTATNQPDGRVEEFAPEFDWIVDVVNQCREYGVPYYIKENLGMKSPGMSLPKMGPNWK